MKKLLCTLGIIAAAAIGIAQVTLPAVSTRGIGYSPATGRVVGVPFGQLPASATHADPALSVDRLIAGKSATTDRALFTSMAHTGTPAYVRNPVWADLDLTCYSPWNSHYGTQMGGVAISPRHVLLAEHFSGATGSGPVPNGTTWRFITADNVIVDRTITSKARVGTTDLCIALLNADLPDTITPARVLPTNYAEFLAAKGVPVIYSDLEKKLHVREVGNVSSTSVSLIASTDALRAPWNELATTGDSGSPMLALFGRTPVVLGPIATIVGGDIIAPNVAATNAVMATLGGGYALTQADPATLSLSRDLIASRLYMSGAMRQSVLDGSLAGASGLLAVTNAAGDAIKGTATGGIGVTGVGTTGGSFNGGTTGISVIAGTTLGSFINQATFESFTIGGTGALSWSAPTAKSTTRTNLGTPAVSIRAVTGDAAAPTGDEPTITINTFDNNVKIYAEGAWRTLATW